MQIDLLAQRTRYLKETPEGVSEMCREMEKMRDRSRAEGRQEGRQEGELAAKREVAIELQKRNMPIEAIAEIAKVSIELVKQWLTPASA